MDRPRIKPWLRPLARRTGEVQFGVDAGGFVVEGLTDDEAALLRRLDGTLSVRASFDEAERLGVGGRRWRQLLHLAQRLELLEERAVQPVPQTGRTAHVVVDGAGAIADECAQLLRRCGVARVTHGRTAVDVLLAAPEHDRPDAVVLVGQDALDPRRGDPWLRLRVPHLPVVATGPRAQVGPMVDVGATSPCLWCLDLHRADRDDDWPTLLAQLCGPHVPVLAAPAPRQEPPQLAHLAAGVVAVLTLGVLGGGPVPLGVSVEVCLTWPRMDHRRWVLHPRCHRHVRADTGVA